MLEVSIREIRTVKLTYLAKAFAETLETSEKPLATDYQLYLIFRKLYENPEGLHLRNKTPTVSAYRKSRNLLIKANKLGKDPDYPWTYRILSKQDLPAEDVCCIVDENCYISHLSAMQKYGLSERRPEALHLTTPSRALAQDMNYERMTRDFGPDFQNLDDDHMVRLNITHHPKTARKRKIQVNSTSHFGQFIKDKRSYARISTIGQTFLDMIEEPDLCGGMAHVIDVWQEHAETYLDDIVKIISTAPKSIHKVRAGYLISEVLNINNAEVNSWKKFAQRGGSRVLDPTKPFINKYSEEWMLSINV